MENVKKTEYTDYTLAYDVYHRTMGRYTEMDWHMHVHLCVVHTKPLSYIPLLTDGGAGVIVKPAFCVKARRSRTVAFDNDTASRPILKSTTSSTSIFSMADQIYSLSLLALSITHTVVITTTIITYVCFPPHCI